MEEKRKQGRPLKNVEKMAFIATRVPEALAEQIRGIAKVRKVTFRAVVEESLTRTAAEARFARALIWVWREPVLFPPASV